MDSSQLMILHAITKAPKPQINRKKVANVKKFQAPTKLAGFTRAETHLGIARFIKENINRN